MVYVKAKIVSNRNITGPFFKMQFEGGKILKLAKPGQFIHVKCAEGTDPLLRRPISIHRVVDGKMEILYQVVGKGTGLLSKMKEAQLLDCLGPLGNGFVPNEGTRTIISIAGGIGIAPIPFIVEKYNDLKHVVLFGAKSKEDILCQDDFKDLGARFEVATEDGSFGFNGRVTDLAKSLDLSSIEKPIQVFACGPKGMFLSLVDWIKDRKLDAKFSLDRYMGCGVGACMGCVVKVAGSYQRVCKDGPVFNGLELEL